jgi:coproporphyrinogen III oxidase-like Fe-S oxidoreductase
MSVLGRRPRRTSQGWRWRNRPHLREWEESIDAAQLPSIDIEHLAPHHRAPRVGDVMLRLAEGIDLAEFAARTGFSADELFSGAPRPPPAHSG